MVKWPKAGGKLAMANCWQQIVTNSFSHWAKNYYIAIYTCKNKNEVRTMRLLNVVINNGKTVH